MNKITLFLKKLLLTLAVIAAVIFFLRFVVGGSEDDWICDNGQWVKHGVPSAPMPEEPCD
jgi:hypothetical protein